MVFDFVYDQNQAVKDLIASNLTLTLRNMLIGNVEANVVVASRPPRRSFCQTMANNKLLYRRRRRDDAFYVAMRLAGDIDGQTAF